MLVVCLCPASTRCQAIPADIKTDPLHSSIRVLVFQHQPSASGTTPVFQSSLKQHLKPFSRWPSRSDRRRHQKELNPSSSASIIQGIWDHRFKQRQQIRIALIRCTITLPLPFNLPCSRMPRHNLLRVGSASVSRPLQRAWGVQT